MRLMRSPVLRQNIVSGGQCRQYVAAVVNEGLHASRPQLRLVLARPPGEINVARSGRLEPLGGRTRVFLVDLVRGAQAGEWRGRVVKSRGKGGTVAFAADRLDAAGLEEILGKTRARGELRRRAEIGEEDFRPRAGSGQMLSDRSRNCSNGSASRSRGSASAVTVASFFRRRFDRRDVKNRGKVSCRSG